MIEVLFSYISGRLNARCFRRSITDKKYCLIIYGCRGIIVFSFHIRCLDFPLRRISTWKYQEYVIGGHTFEAQTNIQNKTIQILQGKC